MSVCPFKQLPLSCQPVPLNSYLYPVSLSLQSVERVLPGVEHDHENVAGAVPHPHHYGRVPIVILLWRVVGPDETRIRIE